MDLMDYRRKIIMSSPHLSHAEGAVATFTDGTDLPLKSLLVNIDPVQSGSGDPSPTNIRPISGWSAVNLSKTGANMLPPMVDGTYTGNGITAVVSNGVATLSGTSTASGNALIIPLAEEYTVTEGYLHLCNSVANGSFAPTLEDVNAISASNVSWACSPVNRVAAIPSNRIGQKWNRVRIWISSGVTVSGTYAPMVCADNIVKPYEAYTGQSVTVQLGQTVYGGTLNVISGELVVDSQIITGNANWGNYWNSHKAEQVDTNKRASFMLSLTNETVYAQRASAKCNMLIHDIVVLNGLGNKSAFCLHPTLGRYLYACLPLDTLGMSSATSATSDADFKNAIKAMGDNLQIVIPLATPQTYTLDPQTVRTLVGQNNIFSDTGNIALDYWAHP